MRFEPGKGRGFFQEQLQLMSSGQIDRLIDEHYHPEAVMVTFDGIRRGPDELRRYYVERLASLQQVTELAVKYYVETEDCILFQAELDAVHEHVHADNALYFKDGQIYRHLALTILDGFDYDAHGTRWVDVAASAVAESAAESGVRA
ncbi:MAG: hypothetical protein ACRDOI_42755 [Trebonia sp.]